MRGEPAVMGSVASLSEGSDMTLAVGAVATDGLVVAADRRTSKPNRVRFVVLDEDVDKIHTLAAGVLVAHCGKIAHNTRTVLDQIRRELASPSERRPVRDRAEEIGDIARRWMKRECSELPERMIAELEWSIAFVVAGYEADGTPGLYRLRQDQGYQLGTVARMVYVGNPPPAAENAMDEFEIRHTREQLSSADVCKGLEAVFAASCYQDGAVGPRIDFYTLRPDGSIKTTRREVPQRR